MQVAIILKLPFFQRVPLLSMITLFPVPCFKDNHSGCIQSDTCQEMPQMSGSKTSISSVVLSPKGKVEKA